MTSKLKCPWCDREMMYSVLGQNLTSSHFCDNVDCKAFQMVLPDDLWKDIFAWKQSQKDLETARKALGYYADSRFGKKQDDGTYVLEIDKGCGVSVVYTYDPRPAKQAIEHIADVSKMVEHKDEQ